MIAYLNGKITYKSPTHIYVDVAGVGYHVNISLHTYSAIESMDQAKIYTYFHVKEDAQTLYGFVDEGEKQIFVHLISVNGVGPNTARVILSYMTTEEVKSAILSENVPALNAVKGIGPKTAKRIILDLKDKIFKDSADQTVIVPQHNNTVREEALSALMALGFPKASVSKSITQILNTHEGSPSVEELIKLVLKQMS